MTTHEALTDARALIERGWTLHAMARDSSGAPVYSTEPTAVCWCLAGAMGRVAGDDVGLMLSMGVAVKPYTRIGSLTAFNDTHTKAEILAVLDKAIGAQEQ